MQNRSCCMLHHRNICKISFIGQSINQLIISKVLNHSQRRLEAVCSITERSSRSLQSSRRPRWSPTLRGPERRRVFQPFWSHSRKWSSSSSRSHDSTHTPRQVRRGGTSTSFHRTSLVLQRNSSASSFLSFPPLMKFFAPT